MFRNARRWIPFFLGFVFSVGACSCEPERKTLQKAPSVPTELVVERELHFDALGLSAWPSVRVLDQLGEEMQGVTLHWSTSDGEVVQVDDGRLTSVGNGEATVEVRVEEARAPIAVTVRQRAVRVEVEPEELVLQSIGEEGRLFATARDRTDHPVEGAEIVWALRDEAVGTIDRTGRVRAVEEGTTEALARVEGSDAEGMAKVVVAPAPTILRFHFSRPYWVAGAPTEVQVEILDASGHRIESSSQEVELSLGENPAGGALGGTLRQRASGGIALFSDLRIDRAGEGYTLLARLGTVEGESLPFDVVAGPASRLRFVQQPADGVAGRALAPVLVQVEDGWGNRVWGASHPVVLRLVEAPGELQGTIQVQAEDGIATFAELWIERAAPLYHLEARVDDWEPARSEPFAIHPAAAAGLVWLDEPRDAASGEDIGPVRAAVVDAFGNTAPYAGELELSLLPEDSGAKLSGETRAEAKTGLATFGPLSVDLVGTYSLALQAGVLGPLESRPFSIRPGAPARLRFVQSPSGGIRNELLSATEVEILDAAGNRSSAALPISMALLGGPGALSGTLEQVAAQGAALFLDLRIDREGTGYRLEASSDGLERAQSSAFDVAACPAGRTDCEGQCVDLQSDDDNCGTCGRACAEGQSCGQGACRCDDPALTACGDLCVDIANDPAHCGACGPASACRADEICERGSCVCPAGMAACDGACVDVSADPQNCGGCGTVCGADRICSAGQCLCVAPLMECQGQCVDLWEDPNFCGSCTNACGAEQLCDQGLCVCNDPTLTRCGPLCVDTDTNAQNCGACGNACGPGQMCSQGECVCSDPSLTHCGGLCVNPDTDAQNCGACGKACGPGQMCSQGDCVCSDPSLTRCEGLCVNTDTDEQNCGTCGNACGPGIACVDGQCFDGCPPDQQWCDGACVDILRDDEHCGGCNQACAANATCEMGSCEPTEVPPGTYDYTTTVWSGITDPRAGAWHPSRAYALVAAYSGPVFKYENGSLTQVTNQSGVYWSDIVFTEDGSKAYVVGYHGSTYQGRIYIWDHATESVAAAPQGTRSNAVFQDAIWSPEGELYLLGNSATSGSNIIASLYRYDPANGIQLLSSVSAGSNQCRSMDWVDDGGGSDRLLVTCNLQLREWTATEGWSLYQGSHGNLGNVSSRPQKDYALTSSWSSGLSNLHRYINGGWNMRVAAAPYASRIDFNSSGRRALIMRAKLTGASNAGIVWEYRHRNNAVGWIERVDIPGANFMQNSNQVNLNAVVWKPGCDEGIILAGSAAFNQTSGYLIEFKVVNGKACPP